MNKMEDERKTNIVAVTADDKYCATILETGEVRIMKFNNNKIFSFDKYLSLENEVISKEKQKKSLNVKLSRTSENLGFAVIQGFLAIVMLGCLQFVLNDIPSIISLLARILTYGIGTLSIGMIASNVKKICTLKKREKELTKQIEDSDEYLDSAYASYERVIVPMRDTIKSLDSCIESIKDSASCVSQLLQSYIQERMKDQAHDFKIIYLDNDVYEGPLNIRIPMSEDKIQACEKIVSNVAKEYNYRTIREDYFPLTKDEQKRYVLKLPF